MNFQVSVRLQLGEEECGIDCERALRRVAETAIVVLVEQVGVWARLRCSRDGGGFLSRYLNENVGIGSKPEVVTRCDAESECRDTIELVRSEISS